MLLWISHLVPACGGGVGDLAFQINVLARRRRTGRSAVCGAGAERGSGISRAVTVRQHGWLCAAWAGWYQARRAAARCRLHRGNGAAGAALHRSATTRRNLARCCTCRWPKWVRRAKAGQHRVARNVGRGTERTPTPGRASARRHPMPCSLPWAMARGQARRTACRGFRDVVAYRLAPRFRDLGRRFRDEAATAHGGLCVQEALAATRRVGGVHALRPARGSPRVEKPSGWQGAVRICLALAVALGSARQHGAAVTPWPACPGA